MQRDEPTFSADDELIAIDEDIAPSPTGTEAPDPWKVLIVDDDEDVHRATELALRGMLVEDRPVQLLHAHSGEAALQQVAQHEDLAVMLLDVVMESDNAGLKVVREVREALKRSALRVILRTGQPGYAPELETVRNYDINDYKTKSELTRVRLFTSLTASIRVYRQMRTHERMRQGLEGIVRASTELTKLHGMQRFAEGVVNQLCALLGVRTEGLVCAQGGLASVGEPARVIAAAGRFSQYVLQPLAALDTETIRDTLMRCLNEQRSLFAPALAIYFPTSAGRGLAAYVELSHPLREGDRHLLEVFCSSMAVGFENVLLYDRLIDQAYLDPLLRIPNLNRLLELLAAPELEPANSTLALLDIDDFSAINDALGHEFGDAALKAIVARAHAALPECHLARLGSDLFAVLGHSGTVKPDTLQHVFGEAFEVAGQRVRLSATIGLVQLGTRDCYGPELLKDAHVALKQAKLHHRGTAVYFSAALGQDARERMHLLRDLREAFDAHNHFFVVYQPKVRLEDGRPSGVEALLRWRTTSGELIPPDRFIPLAEQSGLMTALGAFVMRTACQQLRRLRDAGHETLGMAINVSHAQLRDPDFMAILKTSLDDAGVPGSQVELEITESMAADDLDLVRRLLAELQTLGVRVAIDDFGTGFSSLSVLRHLDAQRLKIDRSFVNEMLQDDSIARMVISLGHTQRMQVTAEGIETEAQRDALLALGCDEGQGWLYAKALEEAALLDWLAAAQA
ncbi:putative bifunctional diguanylate cyclase/phosphodiesterase [Thauera propionica]|uniref:putative bifunctional diguanylate cyclase/phosphodiesterase n=1 Tax=Thauera propionica TaxID=2019431 RepID=UPI0023F24D0A|nr:EAL domain-containing protein [Thauera propionica]MDD3673928.1 EAL domain-containing protein [Thauera propionica]